MKNLLCFVALVTVGILTRWAPHPANFAALLAIAIYAGFVLPPSLALITPVLAAFLGDAWLGFHEGMWFVYLSLLPLVLIGRGLPELKRQIKLTWLSWIFSGLGGALFFYFTTNLAVWWTSGMYPHTSEGFVSCFVLAIPFFHNSLLSTWLYLGVFEAVRQTVLATQPLPITAR